MLSLGRVGLIQVLDLFVFSRNVVRTALFSILVFVGIAPLALGADREQEQAVRASYREYVLSAVAHDPKIARFFTQSFLANELQGMLGNDDATNAYNSKVARRRLFIGEGLETSRDPISVSCSGSKCEVESAPRQEKSGPVTLTLTFVAAGPSYLIDRIGLNFK
jgi:hypothetical protein